MNVLILDPAESTGYCLVKLDTATKVADIYEYGFIDVEQNFEFSGDRYINLMQQITEIIKKHDVKHVAVEDYFFSQRFANGSDVNAAYRTAIHIQCRLLGIPYTILNISLWKKFIAGSSKPTKPQKAKWGKEPAKKLMIQEALWTKYGIRFPNHSLSKKTGKPIKFRYDVVDVVGQAIFFCRLHMDMNEVKLSMIPVPDIPLKATKTTFEYKGE